MTVHVYTGLDDPLGWAWRVLRKAQREGHLLWVVLPGARVNRALSAWCAQEPQGFVAMAGPQASEAVRRRSRIQVFDAAHLPSHVPPGARLLHLAPEPHPQAGAFETVLDAVGLAPDEVQAGRRRFRTYQAWGLDVRHRPAATP